MSGPKLMKEIAAQQPDLTIEELLDRVRNAQLKDWAGRLKSIQTNSVLELLEAATTWDLSREDVEQLLRIMIEEFPPEIGDEARRLLESQLGWSIYIFIQKHYVVPDRPGCFFRVRSWPWCSRSTNTRGTDRPSPGSCS